MSFSELVVLFDVAAPTLKATIRAIHKSGVIAEHTQHCEVMPYTYWATLYNMDMIVALAFRINSYGAEKIRTEVIDGGSAAGNLEVDDVIIGIDGKRVKNFAELQEGLAKHRPGDKVTVKVLRDKKEKDIEMTLKNAQGTTKVVKSAGMDILGAAFREVPQELKRQLNLGYGVEVTGVTDGKMKAAGIRKGFIILKANGQPVKSVNDLEDVLKAATQSPDQVLFLSGMFPSG